MSENAITGASYIGEQKIGFCLVCCEVQQPQESVAETKSSHQKLKRL